VIPESTDTKHDTDIFMVLNCFLGYAANYYSFLLQYNVENCGRDNPNCACKAVVET